VKSRITSSSFAERALRRVPQPSTAARLAAFVKKMLVLQRILVLVLVALLGGYLISEARRPVIVIEPFNVPKNFQDSGITSEVLANHVGERAAEMERDMRTRLRSEKLSDSKDQTELPDIEIPGAKLSLKTAADVAKTIFGIRPKRISGDIILLHAPQPTTHSAPQNVLITVYFSHSGNRTGHAASIDSPELEPLVQKAAEMVLREVNPYKLAVFLEEHSRFDDAAEIISQDLQDPVADPVVKESRLILHANVLEGQSKFAEAEEKYREALKIDPNDPVILTDLGELAYSRQDFQAAIGYFGQAIKKRPDFAPALTGWADVLSDQKRYDEADETYRKANSADPHSTTALNNWGDLLIQKGDFEGAIPKFENVLAINPRNSTAYCNWGEALLALKKYDQAAEKFKVAISFRPQYQLAQKELARALAAQGKTREAERENESVRRLNKDRKK
jgi:tetratricopeptide (TPR) repeat protein